MSKRAVRVITVSDEKHPEPVTLQPGDEVPSWADEYMREEWVDDGSHAVAAGTDLVTDDHTRPQLLRAAERVGLDTEQTASLSNEQIAALVNAKLFDDEVEENLGEDEEPPKTVDRLSELFGATNEAGNVNAPDQEETRSRRTRRTTSESSGGSDS